MKFHRLTMALPGLLFTCMATTAQTTTKLPSQITTLDGKTYQGVAGQAVAVYPDGIVIEYQPTAGGQPVPGGLAVAKLRFRNLADEVQKLYPYDAKAAADYQTQQAQATSLWVQAERTEERAIIRYRNLAELHRCLAGDADASYSVALESNGKVSAQGYARPVPAQTITNVSIPPTVNLPPHNPLFNWPQYVPVETVPGPVVVTK